MAASDEEVSAVDLQQEVRELRDQLDQLTKALATRDVIGRAVGILMHAVPCAAEDAFQVLIRASQNTNRKLHSIAADLVAEHDADAIATICGPERG